MRIKPKTVESLSLQELNLTRAAIGKTGTALIDYELGPNGNRLFNTSVTDEQFALLVHDFSRDPKESLAYIRDNLFAIGRDTKLPAVDRSIRLRRYLHAYTSLTIKLDHEAFSQQDDGSVHAGVPDYIPDGLIDMGSESSVNPSYRSREQIKVNKAEIYRKYSDVLMRIFSMDISKSTSTDIKKTIVKELLLAMARNLPYDTQLLANTKGKIGTGVVNLHSLNEGVCRHRALTYQVLAQACGLTSRLVKCDVDGEKHAANATRIDYQWYLADPTMTDYAEEPGPVYTWRPGVAKISHEPRAGEKINIAWPVSKQQRTYTPRNDMFWRIDA